MDEIIEEPSLDASQCSFHSPNSETIKYYYKLKYPHTYSLTPSKMLDLLENQQVYSDLKESIKAFIRNVRKPDSETRAVDLLTINEVQSDEDLIFEDNNITTTTWDESCVSNETLIVMPEVVIPPTDFSIYDSVHSIKVPMNNACMEKANSSEFIFDEANESSAVVEVPYSNGLTLMRLEKPVRMDSTNTLIGKACRPRFGRKSLIPFPGIQLQAKSKETIKITGTSDG